MNNDLISITANGDAQDVPQDTTIQQFLEASGYAGATVAVAVNLSFVPRSEYTRRTLAPGDEVEIVAPMQGG